MGLSDDYGLPERYNDAYHVCGDGVCVPVVGHIAAHLLEPLLQAHASSGLAAAEVDGPHGRPPWELQSDKQALEVCDRSRKVAGR